MKIEKTCPRCKGDGEVLEELPDGRVVDDLMLCPECEGTGYVEEEETIQERIESDTPIEPEAP